MMFSIIEHIEYLTTCHDCVTIPGWGAFIANYSTAHYNEAEGVMKHPCRAIGFNASVSHNDGLLAQSLMRREGMNYDDAMRFIGDSVTTFRQQLAMDNEVSMGRLGYFHRNQNHHPEFVPFDHDNTTDQYFGLADVDIRPVEMLEHELEAQQAAAVIVPKGRNLFTRKVGQIAASVAVLIGLGVLLSTPIIVDRNHDVASMAPEVTAPKSQQLGTTIQQGVIPQSIEMVEPNAAIAAIGNNTGKYYMVIATLRNQQELEAFKSSYPALVPYMKLLDYKGMMCVYVARSDDYSQLMSMRSELPEKLRDIWIYN